MVRYHYQGKIWEAPEEDVSWAGHAHRIAQNGGKILHYIWPEQIIRDGVPARDPYGIGQKGPVLNPAAYASTARTGSGQEPHKPSGPRPASGEGTALADLCQELGIEPSLARRTLRKKMARPEGRWVFTAAEVPEVLKILGSLK